MATSPAVAANLMQTSPSQGGARITPSGKTTESFSSHLQAATGKQEKQQAKPQKADNTLATSSHEDSSKNEAKIKTNQQVADQQVVGQQVGDQQVGDQQVGDQQVGDQQVGDQQVGDQQVGDQQVGDQQVVNQQMGSNQQHNQETVVADTVPQRTEEELPLQENTAANISADFGLTTAPTTTQEKQQPENNPDTASLSENKESVLLQMLAQITAPQSNAAQQEQTIQVVSAPLPSSQKTTSAAAFENTKADPQVLPGQWTQLAPKGNLQQEQASTVQWSQQTLSSQTSPVAASGQEPLQNQSAGPGTTFSIPTESEPISVQASTGAQVIFNPKDGTIVTSTTPQQQQRADEILKSPESSLLFQNKDGQSISIEQGKDPLQSQPPATALSGNQTLYQKAANLDLNSRYIHSHLISTPTATTAVDNQSMGSDQSQSGMLFDGNQKFQAMQDMKPISLFQEGGVQTLGTSLFGTQLASSQLTSMTTLTSGAETTYYQLGSGSMVPDTAVVDQMISHFSANKQLETSTVNLKLHPQELGELRLEIKVEQDNVKAHIVTQSPHSQEMLDRHLPKLREALEQQGLHLQDIEVSVADGNAGFEEQFANNSGWQQSQQSMSQRNTRSDFSMELTEEAGEEEDVDTNFNAIA